MLPLLSWSASAKHLGRSPGTRWLASGTCLVLLALLYAMYLTPGGTYGWDDGYYLILGKSLATGQGYRAISMAGQPFECALPPLYPWLLAGIWSLFPDYPANLWALKSLNIGCALLAVVALYGLVTQAFGASKLKGWMAAGLLALNSSLLIFVDVTMSECAYIAASLLALWGIETFAKREHWNVAVVLSVAALALLPELIRSLGLALGVAVALWLLLNGRYRTLGLYLVAMALVHAPWQVWVYQKLHSGAPTFFDYASWVDRRTGGNKLEVLRSVWLSNARDILGKGLPGALVANLGAIAHGRHIAPFAPLVWGLSLGTCLIGFIRTAWPRPRITHLYFLVYIAVIAVFPWPPTRYVVATAPLLIYWLVAGAWWLGGEGSSWGEGAPRGHGSSWGERPWALALGRTLAASVLVLCVSWGVIDVALHVARSAHALGAAVRGEGTFTRVLHDLNGEQKEQENALGIRTAAAYAPKDAVILCRYEFLVYLLTGHQTLHCFTRPAAKDQFDDALARVGDRPLYVLLEAKATHPNVPPEIAQWPRIVLTSPTGFALYARPQGTAHPTANPKLPARGGIVDPLSP
jgi:hypothetical protein